MSKRHDAVFDAVLSGLGDTREKRSAKDGSGTRFLKRGAAISERMSGELEEKTLHWVDPAECRMWDRHNRDYDLLTEDNCRELIDGIRSQGRQEFPAIVRRLSDGGPHAYEVICGARRHFAVSWLRRNNYPQFRYLVDVRDMSDEEAFRLADIENRDREDISDYERAIDYAKAIKLYYDGKQKTMAQRLEVSETWLSRYLGLAKLPAEIVDAFHLKTDIRELHARTLNQIILKPADRKKVFAEAARLREVQEAARAGREAPVDPVRVVSILKAAVIAKPAAKPAAKKFAAKSGDAVITAKTRGRAVVLEFPGSASREDLESAFQAFLDDRFK